MNYRKDFTIGLAMMVVTIVLFFIFEPGITPLYQAIILLVSFMATIASFVMGIAGWLRRNKAA
ncbi:MAG: hypothetical protein ICV65_11045 [Flavisolibacter sp.]|nr:hypothetical protein [Flavisolibacter sp.]